MEHREPDVSPEALEQDSLDCDALRARVKELEEANDYHERNENDLCKLIADLRANAERYKKALDEWAFAKSLRCDYCDEGCEAAVCSCDEIQERTERAEVGLRNALKGGEK